MGGPATRARGRVLGESCTTWLTVGRPGHPRPAGHRGKCPDGSVAAFVPARRALSWQLPQRPGAPWSVNACG